MKKGLAVALALMLAAILVATLGCTLGSASPGGGIAASGTGNGAPSQAVGMQPTGIQVGGQGSVSVTPDVVILRLGVEAQAATVAQARQESAETMDRVMAALTATGVAEKDIQTRYFSIHPVRKWYREDGQEVLVGYRVSNMVTAKVREIDSAGPVIDAVVEAGGDLVRIQGIDFTVDDPSAYYSQAREKAMADARAKAEQLASLAGVTLGKPIYIAEGSGYIPVPRMFVESGAAPAAPTPISPGEVDIQLMVQVVYSIAD